MSRTTSLLFHYTLQITEVQMSQSAYIMSRPIIITLVWTPNQQPDQLTCNLMTVVIPLDNYLETHACKLLCEL